MKDANLKFNLKYQHLIKSHSLNDVIYLVSLQRKHTHDRHTCSSIKTCYFCYRLFLNFNYLLESLRKTSDSVIKEILR